MKYQYKALLSTALIWIVFLIIASFKAIHESLLFFSVLTALFGAINCAAIWLLNTKQNLPKLIKETNTDYLAKITRYDKLTHLPNQYFFNEILNKGISHSRRHNQLLAILL